MSCDNLPDNGKVVRGVVLDLARLLPVTYAVSALLVAMSVLLLYADIVKPVKLT